jgi:hypothetical protein
MKTAVHAERRTALLQLLAILALGATLIFMSVKLAAAPADKPELAVAVGELRSQAAELAQLEREQDAGRIDARFVSFHSIQLARSTRNAYRELTELEVIPELSELKADAVRNGSELVTAATNLRAGTRIPRERAERLRDEFARIDSALEH